MSGALTVPDFITVTLGFAVFLVGVRINRAVPVLHRFNIPDAVTGGLLASLIGTGVFLVLGTELQFELETRDIFLVIFFAAIGLNARLADLISGGRPLLILLGLTLLMILAQNVVGMLGASLLGVPMQAGVLFGSASLIGGHGTAIAWAPEVAAVTGMDGAVELGVATATLGLVIAALVGGPVARYLVTRHKLEPSRPDEAHTVGLPHGTEDTGIDQYSVTRVLFYLHLAVILGYLLSLVTEAAGLRLPLFVPCLIMGIVIANLRSALFPKAEPVSRTPTLSLVSEFMLGGFLAMSLMSLQLWTLADIGLVLLAVLGLQTLMTVGFVVFLLFPAMGRSYRGAVLASGFAGFALGATPTAIANMTAVTKSYGPSPIAFVVLPLVSAFFVDLANAVVIQTIVNP